MNFKNEEILSTQELVKDALRSKLNLRDNRVNFIDEKMMLKFTQRAR